MRYRDSYIEKLKTLADSDSEIIDINIKQPITELYIEMRANNAGSSAAKNSPLARCISKVELVDGSTVLYSLSGQQVMANCCFDMLRFPCRIIQSTHGDAQLDTFPIRFGRWFGDTDYAFLPTKFSNPQLKITWDIDANNAVTDGDRATDTAKLTVIARIMEDAPEPSGFLMTKEVINFTTAGSGDERIDLPIDHPYRRLMIRSFETQVSPASHISNLKLSMDQDAYIPFDISGGDQLRMMENHYGKFSLSQHLKGDTADLFEMWVGNPWNGGGQLTGRIAGDIWSANHFWNAQLYTTTLKHDGTATAPNYFYAHAEGVCPENTFAFPFGNQDDPKDWLKAPDFGSLRLFLTQGNPGGEASVFIQQEKLYAAA